MEQRDINDIFDSLELDKDDINLKEISTEKINKDYSNNLIKLYKNIYIFIIKIKIIIVIILFLNIKRQGILFLN
jgi:hypothetical protein